MKGKRIKPTESELQVLQLLWDEGPMTVRQVNELLNEKREVGYTTTLKIMQIMTEKGLVKRDTTSRSHIYVAAAPEDKVKESLLDGFIDSAFRGSASKMVMQLLGSKRATESELNEIKEMIEKFEKKKQL